VNFIAKGRNSSTLYSSSAVVPEKVTLIEPSPDATFLPGQAVYIKWEGGEPSTCFQVLYVGDDGDIIYSSHILEQQSEHTIPAGVIQSGAVTIILSGFDCQGHRETDIHTAPSRFTFEFQDM